MAWISRSGALTQSEMENNADIIINYRSENGSFSKIEDIMNINGIKEGLFNKISEYITV